MSPRRLTAIVGALFLLTSFPVWSDASPSDSNDPVDFQMTRRIILDESEIDGEPALRIAPPSGALPTGGALRLTANGSTSQPTELYPLDVNTEEYLATPVLVSLEIRPKNSRTHLFICHNATYHYQQVPSSVPLKFLGAAIFRFYSDALPEGQLTFLSVLGNQVIESDPSATAILRASENNQCGTLHQDFIASVYEDFFGYSPEEAMEIAREFLASEITYDFWLRSIVQSVEIFYVYDAAVSVYGD